MRIAARAVLASFLLSLPGASDVRAQAVRTSVPSLTAAPAPIPALPAPSAPSLAAP